MQLATLLKNMFLGDDHQRSEFDFAKLKKYSEGTFFTVDLDDSDNQLFQYLIWPMNTFHLIARIFDTYDVYQKVVSIENKSDEIEQLVTGRHARTWPMALLRSESRNSVDISPRFYNLLYRAFGPSKVKTQIDVLLKDPKYLNLLFELYVASDACGYQIQQSIRRSSSRLISRYTEKLISRKQRSIISSLSQCDKSYGVVQFKSHTPQAGISLNSLSHDLAYIKPGIEVTALVGSSTKSEGSCEFDILILPWPLEVKNDNFQLDDKPTLQMGEEFGFFSYQNLQPITSEMLVYAIESAGESMPNLVVIPECAVASTEKRSLLLSIRSHFSERNIFPPVIIFGVFGEGTSTTSYGENSLELFYQNRFVGMYVAENQQKHHRWALDAAQLNTYGLGDVLSTDKIKWWENCATGERKLISYRDENVHICPLICEDLARQDPIAPILRALGPDLVIALLLDGPQIPQRWPGTYAKMLTEEPGSSVLSISPYGMTRRSTGDIDPKTNKNFEPSSNVALWSEAGGKRQEIELEAGRIGVLLSLKVEEAMQWSADGRGEIKRKLIYSSHQSVGDTTELEKIGPTEVQNDLVAESI
ncbi:hypothetical protein [Grimontia sp. SpTr1]|uniref:hypothetical protein n=1 Tax=Grimontia sp. SpTr1 TaxID=2995319 RepID=UPI00248B6543|nr:hypothetical protein [Grimontia sp. SpTr1]